MAAKLKGDFFESYDEEFFGLDVDTFDLSFSHPVPEHGIDGQSLFTDGSGRVGWGGLNYNILLADDFKATTIDRTKWIKQGAGTETTVSPIFPECLLIYGGTIQEVANIEPFSINEITQVKIESRVYLLGINQTDYCFFFGLHSLADDDTWIWLYQDSSCDPGQYKFACWNQGDMEEHYVSIDDEVWTDIAIVVNKGRATFYKNGVATVVIRKNISTDALWDFRVKTTTDMDEVVFDYIYLKQIITGDAF
jgi:hypothetical protein